MGAHWLIFIVNMRTDTWIWNSCDASASESGQFCNCKKQIDVSLQCVCPVIDNEYHHNIVKVVCGSTATLTMLWWNSWSITGQRHKNWRQFVNWYLSKQGIRWPVSHDYIAGSNLQLIEVTCFCEVDRWSSAGFPIGSWAPVRLTCWKQGRIVLKPD